ncbi:uncharacterized protein BKCO1_7600010 [Diplodia corticola]|uniref:Uncharacterized protein n=1 Tax=Diplodia corticola TaxID=236234 RepID=A0A1J9QNI1_9PEZI|nr:uncharacterized protein BKCO1_7600010 [Diplodia corticola]OJD29618.1 hypothetical protein BKCO1_7600010 [Diplodia corticola]
MLPALSSLSIHLLPLVATSTIVFLNTGTKYVGIHVSTTWLQFLAKFVELLAQASISGPVYMYLRHELTWSDGLPFGAIFSGLAFRNISYLWSLEFLGSISSTSFRRQGKIIFVIFTIFNILLASAIGPSIAVGLIPRTRDFTVIEQKIWFGVPEGSNALFPSTLSHELVAPECSSMIDTRNVNYSCPSTGWEYLKGFGYFEDSFASRSGATSLEIKAVSFENGDRKAKLSSNTLEDWISKHSNSSKAYTATSLQMFLLSSVVSVWSGAQLVVRDVLRLGMTQAATEVRGKQPISYVECSQSLDMASGPNGSQPLLPSNVSRSSTWSIEWIELDTDLTGLSIGAFVLPPFQAAEAIQFCAVIAGWAESSTFQRASDGFDVAITQSKDISWNGHAAKITKDWAQLLTPTFIDTNISVFDSVMHTLGLSADGDLYTSTIGILVVSGMMNAGYDSGTHWSTLLEYGRHNSEFPPGPFPFVLPPDGSLFAVPDSQTKGKFAATYKFFVNGPLYSTQGLAVKLSLAVLIAYIVYISTFIIYVIGFSRISSSAWDSISELTALALLSKPTEKLQNTSAGIETMELFKEVVKVYAVGWNHLEMVFIEDQEKRATDTVRANKEY